MTIFSHISFFVILLIFVGNINSRSATARIPITSYSRDQVSCNMCDECDNPCQPAPSPPPPSPPLPSPPPPIQSPSTDNNCPPPPSPPSSGGNSPPATPSVPTFPYYPPPSPTSGGGYGYSTPPPPNPILPYFPFYYYNPPPPRQNSVSDRLKTNPVHILLPLSFLLFFFG
ncbi:leucine-rich repeat extensin-like protein 3 [Lactuca sativa]|uniref:leucine-rich repeat extensin-like protein 3 n=1 Tax=Lactuca sativa TaxID=4236 RepID=UPI000CC39CE2|nr:leucine-rich repeat extensin-like protein 3 [Lactuca sativa]